MAKDSINNILMVLAELARELRGLRDGMIAYAVKHAAALVAVAPQNRANGRHILECRASGCCHGTGQEATVISWHCAEPSAGVGRTALRRE